VAAHLEQHKFYPRAARRRHIEGAVQVSFELLEDGNISNLQILSGHSSLQKATEESIYQALPLPARPQTLLALQSIKIEYAMRFSLRD
jgi:protein TonB